MLKLKEVGGSMRYLFAVLAIAWIAFVYLLGTGYAHEATNVAGQPTGWTYPWACCSGNDCAPLPAKDVQQTPNGYVITVHKGEHPFATSDTPLVYQVAYNDRRVKNSPDGDYHLCLRSPNTTPSEDYKPLDLLCFFRGPEGF